MDIETTEVGGDVTDPHPELSRDTEIAKLLIEWDADVNVKLN